MENINYSRMLVIHGVLFEMIKKSWLREPTQKDVLHAMEDLKAENGFWKGYFNSATKTIKGYNFQNESSPSAIKPFWIPSELTRLSKGVSNLWAQRMNALSRKKGLGVVLIDDPANRRLNMILPVVEFQGVRYKLDLPQHQLRHPEDERLNITIPQMPLLPGFSNQFFLYQNSMPELVPISNERLFRPEPITVVEFPSPMLIDPVGVALAANREPTAFLNLYPQHEYLKLKTYQITDQDLPEKVRKSIESSVRFELVDAAFKYENDHRSISERKTISKRSRN